MREFYQLTWSEGDVLRLQRRVRRMAGDRHPYPVERCETKFQDRGCVECRETNHAHAAVPVGPYRICRCIPCPTLVVTP